MMINKLGKQISITIFILTSIIIVLISIAFLSEYFKNGAKDYNTYVMNTVFSEDLSTFIEDKSVSDLDYCTFHREKHNEEYKLINNHIPNLSDEDAVKYFQKYSQTKYTDNQPADYMMVNRKDTIIMVSKQETIDNFMHMTIVTLVITIALIIGLFYITGFISKKIITPVIESSKREQSFVSNTSHDLKTPLSIIGANVVLLEKEIGQNKHLEYISKETQRMTKLVNNMLELTNAGSHNISDSFKKINLSDTVLSVLLPFESVAYDKGKKYDFDVQENIFINGNSEKLECLVSILIDNAVAYSDERGEIFAKLFSKGSRCFLKVANTGATIPKEKLAFIFDRFYREDESRNESGNHFGLGLAIASGIVEAHNAKISVTSENNVTEFTVSFKKINAG